MPKIKSVIAAEILDSRGEPTVETTVILDNAVEAVASVPSGLSVGKYESFELRDMDPTRYKGKGVLKAVENVNKIIGPNLIGFDPLLQAQIDRKMIELDGTSEKKNLGANSILSVSLAVARAASFSQKIPLYLYLSGLRNQKIPDTIEKMPTPSFNIINGGKHAGENIDFQEFHIVSATSKRYYQALRLGEEIYQSLKDVLISKNIIHSIGDEGGFAPNLATNTEAFDLILEAISKTSYLSGQDLFLGLDCSSSNFFSGGEYKIKDSQNGFKTEGFIEYLRVLNNKYHLLILEDPLAQDEWDGWIAITNLLRKETLIVGDDLLATNRNRLAEAIKRAACNAILIKPNQAGTLSETLEVVNLAKKNNFKVIISHRSGETNDSFIADLAVGVAADYVKFGAPVRGERVAKYNRLLEIEKELGL